MPEFEKENWRVKPAPIPDSEIAEEYSADYVVVGCNISGYPVTASIAEESENTVISVEYQPQDRFFTFANDIGHINSKYLLERGVEPVDPIEYYNDFMARSQNAANPDLVMQFAQNMGEDCQWFLDKIDDEYKQYMGISYFPKNPEMLSEIGGQKFWNGAVRFLDKYEKYYLFDVYRDLHKKLMALPNCDIHFETEALQLIQDESGRVIGLDARKRSGGYVRYHVNKAVVLACGDFAANKEMVDELVCTVTDVKAREEKPKGGPGGPGGGMGGNWDGRGIRMGVWAGGQLEPRPLGSMNGDFVQATGTYPGVCICLDKHGNRYMNEYFGDSVVNGKPLARKNYSAFYAIFDGKMPETVKYSIPGHSYFDPTIPENIENIKLGIEYALRDEEPPRPAGRPKPGTGIPHLVAANDLDTLADKLGMDDKTRENMKAAIKRYNELCYKGRDEDYGKDSRVLFPLDTPPYVCYRGGGPHALAGIMVTVGGLMTDKYQNVIDEKDEPIPGLYATGNCCGRRFGAAYFTPVPGTSVGMGITLGRELGKYLASK